MGAFDDTQYRFGKKINEISTAVDSNFWALIIGFSVTFLLLAIVILLLKDMQAAIHEIEHYLEIAHNDDHASITIEQLERAHYGG